MKPDQFLQRVPRLCHASAGRVANGIVPRIQDDVENM
jgi:hypothetical protein